MLTKIIQHSKDLKSPSSQVKGGSPRTSLFSLSDGDMPLYGTLDVSLGSKIVWNVF